MTLLENWLPPGTRGAICLTVDDVHPTPVAARALEEIAWLQQRHPRLRVTFFTTADWRSVEPFPDGRLVSRLPLLRDRVWNVPVLPRGTMRLDRNEEFCRMLRGWPRAELALHGLHHVRRGRQPIAEFAGRSRRDCEALLGSAIEIFENAGLRFVRGLCPPGWVATPALIQAMERLEMRFVASARDLNTPVAPGAVTHGSGLMGVSLVTPQRVAGSLVHFTTNFQAGSTLERACSVIESGGLLAIKAHLLAGAGNYRAMDGLTREYVTFLDGILTALEDRYAESLWWTSMGEIACA